MAVVSYYLKPHIRFWIPGQRESTIKITAPKKVEESRVRDITGEEATHRLSFLVDIVDTGGYAIKGMSSSPMRDDLVAEANTITDMFETHRFDELEERIERNENERHKEVLKDMREAIEENEKKYVSELSDSNKIFGEKVIGDGPKTDSSVVVMPEVPEEKKPEEKKSEEKKPEERKPEEKMLEEKPDTVKEDQNENVNEKMVNSSIIGLASNEDYSVATIAKEANRIKRKDDDEVFISLH